MTGQHRAAVDVQRLVETLIGEVRHVEDHADLFHLLQQRFAGWEQAALRSCPVGVGTDAVMGRADDAQAGVPPFLHLFGIQHRVRPFHAQDETERLCLAPSALPGGDVGAQRGRILDPAQITLADERAIVGQLADRRRRRRLPSSRSAGWPA